MPLDDEKKTLPNAFAISAGGDHEGPQIYEFDFSSELDVESRNYADKWLMMAHDTAKELGIEIQTKRDTCGIKVLLATQSSNDYSLLMNALQPKFMQRVEERENRLNAYAARMVDEHYGDHIPTTNKDDADHNYTPSKEIKRDTYAEQALKDYGDELTQDYGHDDGYTLSR